MIIILKIIQAGDSILRKSAKEVSITQLKSPAVQQLIDLMIATLRDRPGVGLAAPQVGEPVALSVIGIKPTPTRPNNATINMVIINPVIVKTYGRKAAMWEGCVSFGDTKNFPYAKVPRYKKIRLSYDDEAGKRHEADFEGITAHVMQHEVDHLNGVLFVDKVEDATTYMTISEYKRRILQNELHRGSD